MSDFSDSRKMEKGARPDSGRLHKVTREEAGKLALHRIRPYCAVGSLIGEFSRNVGFFRHERELAQARDPPGWSLQLRPSPQPGLAITGSKRGAVGGVHCQLRAQANASAEPSLNAAWRIHRGRRGREHCHSVCPVIGHLRRSFDTPAPT
jgi:hypothetical protein